MLDKTHSFLFLLMALTSLAELGLSVFLIDVGNEDHFFVDESYHSLLILLCFDAAFTVLFSVAYVVSAIGAGGRILAHIASTVLWLLLTAILWGFGAGLMTVTRTGGDCPGREAFSRCRQSLTVVALAWTTFGLCLCILVATITSLALQGYPGPEKPGNKELATV